MNISINGSSVWLIRGFFLTFYDARFTRGHESGKWHKNGAVLPGQRLKPPLLINILHSSKIERTRELLSDFCED